jgi:succinate-semialdehyde dehydrogenase/glutarate-semialdehyde dehydrogenase
MGGMGKSGVGRRHGAEGLLKYTEPQTIAEQRVIGLGGIKGVPQGLFLRTVPAFVKSLKFLPGR